MTMDFGRFATQARSFNEAAFYPTIDIILVVTAVSVVFRNKPTAAVVHRSADPLIQFCYAMLSALAIIQCSNWREAYYTGYYPFQLANLLGVYRSLSGNIGTDIWYRVFYAAMHVYLLLANLDMQSQIILEDLKHMLLFTQERRLLSVRKDRDIKLDDLEDIPERLRLRSVAKEFKYNVDESFFVIRAIFRSIWRPMIPVYILDSLLSIAGVGSSILNSRILHLIDLPSEHSWYEGYGIIALAFCVNILTKQFNRIQSRINDESERISKAVQLELFRLPLTNAGLRKKHSLRNAEAAAGSLLYRIRGIQSSIATLAGTIATIIPIYRHIGWLAFMPVAVSIAISMLEWVLQKLFGNNHQWRSRRYDFSYDVDVDEIHHNIKSIKMFGWERMYSDPELQKHWSEVANSREVPWYAPIVRFTWFLFNTINVVSSQFSVYIAIYIFTTVSADSAATISNADMFQLETLMNDLLYKVESLGSRFQSLRKIVEDNFRLEKALKGDFIDTLPRYPMESVEQEQIAYSSKPSVALDACEFTLKKDLPVLKDISLKAKGGELVAVVGKTGSGKSSLLLSICGEVEKTKGSGAVFGSIALMEQSPWIMNDTVRDNILFGREYDEDHYNRVVEACALVDDIKAWASGDMTVIGEHGINISGGQRARLALARTVYSKADIYVLDDPLSAVDAHVKRHILDKVIMDSGLLGGKLRLVAVNAERLLPYFHQVIRLDDGKASVTQQEPKDYQPVSAQLIAKDECSDSGDDGDDGDNDDAASDVSSTVAANSLPTSPTAEGSNNEDPEAQEAAESDESDEETKPKIREWNKWDNMRYVMDVCGISTLMVMALSGFVRPIFSFVIDGYKLDSLKTNKKGSDASNGAVLRYLRMDMLDTVMNRVISRVEGFIESTIADTHLETRIKSMFVDNLIHAPLSFFDSTTGADLSSAFCTSTDSVSNDIPKFVLSELSGLLEVVLSLYRVLRNAPMLLLSVPFFIWYGDKHASHFTPMHSSLHKLDRDSSISHGKTKNIISGGKRLIRLLNVEPYFTKLHMEGVDIHTKIMRPQHAFYTMSSTAYCVMDWFSESVFKLCLLAQNHLLGHDISSGGLVTYADLARMLIENVTQIIELPSRLFSFNEGIDLFRHYLDMDRDDNSTNGAAKPPSNWPSAGKVEFRNFSMKYRDDLEYALKDINLTIKPGEKIGIVGRTGAGKSSLSRAIFRLVNRDTCKGSILIDGCDISSISTCNLRPQLGTIPQESTLFSGSFKQNLDPLLEYSIEDMWAALVKCNITEFVVPKRDKSAGDDYNDQYREQVKEEIAEWDQMWEKSGWMGRLSLFLFVSKPKLPKVVNKKAKHGLDKDVGHHSRFSNGQQQLFSLCRLLMRRRKIIVLDEATADVDLETDQSMQKLFRSEFKDCTVLTIAHRLETIMGSDRIIVMDKGTVAEFGPPKDLIEKGGLFAELVKANDF
ncbi:Canalicular multispecific organic anion transporter 1 [Coemansia sp. RSA 1646]|nr:Canalicular multispecific organic anion transporter 1 [Coemansia sp. RSA 1646]